LRVVVVEFTRIHVIEFRHVRVEHHDFIVIAVGDRRLLIVLFSEAADSMLSDAFECGRVLQRIAM
jgi:hypothetical protein